jgi:hypothetical protein
MSYRLVRSPSATAIEGDAPPTCTEPNLALSPVDNDCHCIPGTVDFGKGCEPRLAFPDCVDKDGRSIPDCFMGYQVSRAIVPALLGMSVGFLAGALIFRK